MPKNLELSNSIFDLTYVEPNFQLPITTRTFSCEYTHSATELSDCSIYVARDVGEIIKDDAFIKVKLGKYNLGKFQIARKNYRRESVGLETLAVPYLSDVFSDIQTFNFTDTTLDVAIGDLLSGFDIDVKMEVPPYTLNQPEISTTTIDFLRTLAQRFGFTFYLEDGTLVLADEDYLKSRPPVATITPSNIGKDININRDTIQAYYMCEYKYNFPLPGNEKTIKVVSTKNIYSAVQTLRAKEVLKVESSSLWETPIEAFAKAYKALKKANSANFKGTIHLLGNERYTATDVIELADMGNLNGKWRVMEVVHNQEANKIYDCKMKIEKVFQYDEDNFWTYETILDLIASGAINLIDGLPIIGG